MSRLIVGFQTVKSKPTFTNMLMGKKMRSNVYHSELIFEGHEPPRFSAWSDFGTGFRDATKANVGNVDEWIFYDLGTAYYQSAFRFAESQAGKGYDLKTAVYEAFNREVKGLNPDTWYCSEVTYAALKFAGVPLLQYDPSAVLPPLLFDLISSLYPETNVQWNLT